VGGGISGGRAAFRGSTVARGTNGGMFACGVGAMLLCGTGRRCICGAICGAGCGAETWRIEGFGGFKVGPGGDEYRSKLVCSVNGALTGC
jgi:hypothetical protein